MTDPCSIVAIRFLPFWSFCSLTLLFAASGCGEGNLAISSIPVSDADAAPILWDVVTSPEDATFDGDGDVSLDPNGELDDAPDGADDAGISEEGDVPEYPDVPVLPTCSDKCGQIGEQKCEENGIATCMRDVVNNCLVWGEVESCGPNKLCDPQKIACIDACGDHCETFSVVLLPDTQYYTQEESGSANVYNKQLQWIANNKSKENIKFVAHLGDITNNNYISQWEVASSAHEILDKADVPYSMVTGNHDYIGTTPGRSNTHFGKYFGKDRYAGKNWYGGSYATVNNYAFFEVGHMKFMVLSLEYAPRKETVCWANRLIQKYPDRHVIIATHCYLTHDAKYGGSCPKLPYATNGSRGTDLWNELVSQHSNIFMVACGHVGDSEYRKRTGNSGNKVHEMLVDYQYEKRCANSSASACTNHCLGSPGSGNGWLRQLIFDPKNNMVTAKTFTVMNGSTSTFPKGQPAFFCSEHNTAERQWYPSDPDDVVHQYSFSFDMNTVPEYKYNNKNYIGFNARVINSTGSGQQYEPALAMAENGGFIAVWEDDSSSDDGMGNHDIFAKGFFAGGCASEVAEFTVNAETSFDQRHPDIAMDAAGNFVIVWEDDKDGNGYYEIFMRGFYSDGTERFARKKVNTVSGNQQFNPKVAMAPDGRFVVAWEDYSNGAATPQVFMRGFNSDGTPRFADRNVMDTVEGLRLKPDLFLDANANIVVVWEDDTGADGYYQIFAKGFHADGSDRFGRKVVNSKSAGQQRNPAVHGNSSGSFVVVWEDDQDKDGKYNVMGRAFHADGTQKIADSTMSGTSGNHTEPDVCMNEDGAFTVTWTDDSDSTGIPDIYWRHYSATGEAGDASRVNYIQDGSQYRSAIGCTPKGARVVLWEDDNDGNGYYEIFGRGFTD